MFKIGDIFFIIAETPVHPGSGGELGFVDLPIQREKHTKFPKIEASGLKGCIREALNSLTKIDPQKKKYVLIESPIVSNLKKMYPKLEEVWEEKKEKTWKEIKDKNGNKLIYFNHAIFLLFGPEEVEESYAGALTFTDARILLFPVKSLKGIFAWITCPFVLERFREDLRILNKLENDLKNLDFSKLENTVPENSDITVDSKVVLEEYSFEVKEDEKTSIIAKYFASKIFPDEEYKFWEEKLKKSLVILPDDVFTDFTNFSTEIITRTKINDVTGTVKEGALWTEEYLPQETVLYSMVMASPLRVEDEEKKGIFRGYKEKEPEKVLEFFKNAMPSVIQIGGNQTIGKGIVKIQFLES